MVYPWKNHRETLRRLYVEEKKPLDEVVEYMRVHHNFTPSRRSYQANFARWGFPNKLNPAYKNEQLVARVRELWETNVKQKDMISILVNEGYEIGEREVARIRAKNGWLLRGPNPSELGRRRRQSQSKDPDGVEDDEDAAGDDDSNNDGYSQRHGPRANYYGFSSSGLSPTDAQIQEETQAAMREAHREYRKRLMEAEYHERWLAKKRRRHTKAYAGLPPDPPGPPRFPSETTLSESKEILQLDADAYKTLRERFHSICVDAGVYKKTLVGPERWEALKEQLIRESMHLRAVMWDPTDLDKKKLAIEIIACDVTKRIRTETNAVRLADAKTILGLNPEQSRNIRSQLYNILAQEKFTSKLEDGLEYFEALKQRWIAGSLELSSVVADGPTDPDYQRKMKAINVICRDATRRYRADLTRLGKIPEPIQPSPPKPQTTKPAPKKSAEAASKQAAGQASTPDLASAPAAESTSTGAPVSAAAIEFVEVTTSDPSSVPRRRGRPPGKRNRPKPLPHVSSRLVLAEPLEPQADQEMLDAQLEVSMPVTSDDHGSFVDQQYVQGYAAAPQVQQEQAAPASSSAIAVFFRLNSSSKFFFPSAPAQWICPLESRTMADVKNAAVQKTPGAMCYKIEGIVKDGKGGELPLPVSDEAELETYLQHVEGNGAPTFNIHIVPGE
ncbi:uncharacterized protein B0T15DRAFT_497780 [Chaetomium strumarium]|uniref:Clr5 domain-containing protein n=1 Tax=Chaetomium strumarium TaxID=1170767 RepID=A0AAJ0M5E1_9PEZI|nr:hypothetical protein B0T15DRAFT_497780 [Chaetomium strumarium]